MRHALEQPGLRRGEHALDVDARRLEQRAAQRDVRVPGAGVCVGEPRARDDLADEGEAVGVEPRGREAEQDIPCGDVCAGKEFAAFDGSDCKSSEVIIVCMEVGRVKEVLA